MLKGIYTPLSGALAQERVLEIISNNLANINTTGFKGENVTFTLLDPEPEKHYKNPLPPANFKVRFEDFMPLRGNELAYVGVDGVHRDLTQGPVINTSNPLDLMVRGKGHLTVQTPEGIRYTRDGALTLNQDGILVTKGGHPILGERGNIYLRGGQFEVNRLGEIYQDGQLVDRLKIYKFKDERALEKVGQNYLYFGGSEKDMELLTHPNVAQGQLEGSNVNAIKNMTGLIMAHRSYEAYHKAISNFDQMMDKSSNTVGEVRV